MPAPRDVDVEQRLRRLQTLADTGLSRLRGAELTDVLLDRARTVLDAETAAVLVLDRHARQLAVVAAKGLEDEVRRRIRIPVGAGFAGRVASTGEPVMIAEVTAAEVVSPVLIEAGVRSLLGVPMFAGGEVVGVLHVGTRTPRRFTAEDVELLALCADRIGAATVAGTRGLDHQAALALQRSLLPTRLPDVPGLELAARYVPGHDAGVGGDWYDVFPLPGDRLGLVIGDVSGHGLAAAVVMGRLRSALRAYALISADPATVLTHLDHKVHHFEAGSLTTVAYAVISADRTRVDLSLAGHLPPVLAVPGCSAAPVTTPVDAPLGLRPSHRARRTTMIPLPPGALLVCYTDGLVERRTEIIDEGIARLTAAVHPGSAEETCAKTMTLLGLEQPADDIALLVVHRTG
ncbi:MULTISPECIES: PP2C family protein-serine/threonine phosphatase [Catenuloplanes]|uniref:Methionine-R-sulfoxide reductase with GAF domain n=1 Tax=Catenuloplanes niger TaxID=587534 RepID=A0AAE3ZYR4_9ACTN|nr:SpoIIE family protein phosphatase [Catenuloplanes niger]MDR7327422.1 putative methionine-R-sulfoxide reductase with GAF domain [Catenuloplanes niger]